MSEIKERLQVWVTYTRACPSSGALAFDALAEIERLEAERDNWVESSQANASALTKALKQAQDFRAQVETMRTALRALMNSVGQPESDGADMRAWESCVEALSTSPPAETETDEARELRRIAAMNKAIAPYERWSPMFAQRIVRAIAESDREAAARSK